MQHVLVTHASGKLGRQILADLLAKDYRVTGVSYEDQSDTLRALADKENLDLLSCNLADTDEASRLAGSIADLDALIHIPNPPPDHPDDHDACTEQARVTINIISLFGPKIARAIFASSSSVYGETAGPVVPKGQQALPATYHGASLLASERFWDLFAMETSKPVNILRLARGEADIAAQSQSVLSELTAG